MEHILLLISLLVFIGFLMIPLSKKLGAPILLVFLIGGMLVGEDGPGQVNFDDFSTAYQVGSIALALILFAGGLETNVKKLARVRIPAVLLSTLGVLITAIVVGIAATFILQVPIEYGLLLGAVVGSTDAAATFMLIQQNKIQLPARLENTLILESGLNDPMAIFMTIAFTTIIDAGNTLSVHSFSTFIPLFLLQIGVGTLGGIVGGLIILTLLDKVELPQGLYPPMALAGALMVYAGTSLLGGSGFLAIYLCGLVIAGYLKRPAERILNFSEGLQWLSQIVLFLVLGLLVTPSALVSTVVPALMIAGVLMFLARPIAVSLCTLPLGFSIKETSYLSWVGLRGAVPIFLAIFPIISPGPVQVELFNIVFVIVVASLVLQGWTVASAARWLGLVEKPEP